MPIVELKKKKQVRLMPGEYSIFDPLQKSEESMPLIRKKTGIVYDQAVNDHYCPWEDHIEKPERLCCILERCEELGLFSECEKIASANVTLDTIKGVHSESLYQTLKNTENFVSVEELKKLSLEYDSVYFNQKTFSATILSAGSSIEITKAVIQGKVQNGMALIRPPGHHALWDEFNGFCYINNVAVAANYALALGFRKILIVDWDVHHGQGTQRCFYDDPRVLFFSIHRYEEGKFWPHLRDGNFDCVGKDSGKGYNFNIPLNRTGLKNEDYLAIFHQIILPVSYEFSPDLVFVSCGFDSALGCEEGKMLLTPAFFSHLTSHLMSLANGKIIVLLEGGYCLESLAESAAHTLRALMGKPCPRLIDKLGGPSRSVVETILNVISMHRNYWKCFSFQRTPPSHDEGDELSFPFHEPKFDFKGLTISVEGSSFAALYEVEEREFCSSQLKRLKQETSIVSSPNLLCLLYDADMEKHCNLVDRTYPENPRRTEEIMRTLEKFGILERVFFLQSRCATEEELRLCHTEESVKMIKESSQMTPRDRAKLSSDFISIYFSEYTWHAASLASGCLLQVVESVCGGQSQAGLAVIRPPGHHAERDSPNGFCFFNNICIAAQYAINRFSLKRVLILDWDVHHGNGIQHCFEDSSSVLYISIHLYKGGNFFPFSEDADANHVGIGDGLGFNVNIPWSKSGMGDGDYISAFCQVVLPVAYEFDPDLVLVSAGFDAAVNDPLGGCSVTPECFGHLTNLIKGLANGNVILALEGGYNVSSTSYCMAMCAKALLGDPIPPLNADICPSSSAVEDIECVIRIQKEHWQALKFQYFLASFPEWAVPHIDKEKGNLADESNNLLQSHPKSLLGEAKYNENVEDLTLNIAALTVSDASPVETEFDAKEQQQVLYLEEGAVGFSSECLQSGFVFPLDWCPHLTEVNRLPTSGFDVLGSSCFVCCDEKENWICLVCFEVYCGRYVEGHMVAHFAEKGHNIVLSFSDLSVWCYTCENYVHHQVLSEAKNFAHRSKFGIELPSGV